MMVSTKGRYALRIMLDLAQHRQDGFIPLSEISRRQNVSVKYMEAIVAMLSRAGMLTSQRGKDGGYCLRHAPDQYTVDAILRLTEGSIAPVACVEHSACQQADACLTLPMWQQLDKRIHDYLQSVTLQDLLDGNV
ncbi:MAG: Rrf2 family transcriptional regulator [Firmicutes bacterium]|nr:Rrf2 family transcriptional regulator [Bacillota bacterium]MDY2720365.1 Rrf2 family transcriptional regulator [Candidatus Faecousia sp.]